MSTMMLRISSSSTKVDFECRSISFYLGIRFFGLGYRNSVVIEEIDTLIYIIGNSNTVFRLRFHLFSYLLSYVLYKEICLESFLSASMVEC